MDNKTFPSSSSLPTRKIIHLDCDCFFAAVEMRDNPALIHIPIAIGGDAKRRGVISTCNYPARSYGVRSAMPTAHALKLCPHLTMVDGRMDEYRRTSDEVMEIIRTYAWRSDDVLRFDVVSIDEAYVEIDPEMNATSIATEIRQRIKDTLGITVSAGVAPNKFLAKVASEWNKPDGLYVIKPHQVADFIAPLDVGLIPGIGPAMRKKLYQQGIQTCADAQRWQLTDLVKSYGRMGNLLYQRCRGYDSRTLGNKRRRKSVGIERTFSQDLTGEKECLEQLPHLWEMWQKRVAKTAYETNQLAPFVKVKFADFSQTTLSDSHEVASPEGFSRLLKKALSRQDKAVRLLGIGGRCPDINEQQLSLFE